MSLEPISKMGAQHRGRRGARQARRDDREYREYLRKEQRRLAGCIAGRMPSPFLRWVLTQSLCGDRDRGRLDAAIAAVAFLIGDHGLEQMAPPEIGPERLGDPDLGIGDLPEEEVADAHLTARPDEQVGVRLARRVEKLAEAALVEVVG